MRLAKNYEEVIVPNTERWKAEYEARQAKRMADKAKNDRAHAQRQALARAADAKQAERDRAERGRQQAETLAKWAVLDAGLDRLLAKEVKAQP